MTLNELLKNEAAWKPEALPETLKKARKLCGLTLDELSGEIGVNAPYLSQLENGHHRPSYATVWKLRNFYEEVPGYLLPDDPKAAHTKASKENLKNFLKNSVKKRIGAE